LAAAMAILALMDLLSLAIRGFYVYQGDNESKRDYVGHLVSKIDCPHLSQNEAVLIVGPILLKYEDTTSTPLFKT
jgi:hypothetical protein